MLDLGCGECRLLQLLVQDSTFHEIVGLDVSPAALKRAEKRLHLDRLPSSHAGRLRLLHGSLTYRDRRLQGYDAAAIVEVLEHLDRSRLASFERVVFEFTRPPLVIVTTPNVESNPRFVGLADGRLRNPDHRFEWTRNEFSAWAHDVSLRFGYQVRIEGVGPTDPLVGSPTQMGVFMRNGS